MSTTVGRWTAAGIAAAGAVYLLLALTWSIVTPAHWGTDESSNAAYGYHLAHGRWPTIDDPKASAELFGLDERKARDDRLGASWRTDIWTAHQPPLYYALTGIMLRAAGAAWGSAAGMLGARLLTVLFGLGGVLATGWLTRIVVPARPQVAVLASGLVALIPTIPHYAGQVYADALVFCLCTAAFAMTARGVKDCWTDRRVVILAIVWVALALTKATAALAVAAGIMAAVVVRGVRDRPLAHRHVWRPSWTLGAVALTLSAVAAFPYIINLLRYAEPIGSQAVLTKVVRSPSGRPWLANLTDIQLWVQPLDLLIVEISEAVSQPPPFMKLWRMVLLIPLEIGLAIGCWRMFHRQLRVSQLTPVIAPFTAALVLLALSAVWLSRGGVLHARYFFPVVALIGLFLAYTCDVATRSRIIAGPLLVIGMLGATGNLLWLLFTSRAWVERSKVEVLPTLTVHPWEVATALIGLVGLAVLGLLTCYAQTCRTSAAARASAATPPRPR